MSNVCRQNTGGWVTREVPAPGPEAVNRPSGALKCRRGTGRADGGASPIMISNHGIKKKPFYEFILKIKGFYPVRIVEPQMNSTPKSSKKKQKAAGGGITENQVGD